MSVLYTINERAVGGAVVGQGAEVQLSDGTLVFATRVSNTSVKLYYQSDRSVAPVLISTTSPAGMTVINSVQVTRDSSDNLYLVFEAVISGTGDYCFVGLTKGSGLTWTPSTTKTVTSPFDTQVGADLQWLNTGGGTSGHGHLVWSMKSSANNINLYTADAGAVLAGTITAFTSNSTTVTSSGGTYLSLVPDGFGTAQGLFLYQDAGAGTNAVRQWSVSSTGTISLSSAVTVSATGGINGSNTNTKLFRLAAGKFAVVGLTLTTNMLTVQGVTYASPPTLFGTATVIGSMTGINLGVFGVDKDLLTTNTWRIVYVDSTTATQIRYTVLTWNGTTTWTWAGGSTLIDTMAATVTNLGTLRATGANSPSYSDIYCAEGTTAVQGTANVYEQPPNAPTLSAPVGNPTIDRGIGQRFSWVFSDPNVGDSQSKFDLQYRKGTGAWTTVTQTTPNQFYDLPAGTLTSDGSYEWQVRTYDQSSQVGPWSASAFFTAATTPSVPTITAPANNSTVSLATWTLSWSQPSQDAYEVRKVADLAGAPDATTIYYDSGTVTDTVARSVVLSFPTNNRTEHLQVRVLKSGLWSAWADVTVMVAWSPPAVSNITVTPSSATASITVTYSQPTPGGGQPTVAYVDIYRNDGASSIRLAANLPVTGAWTDYTPASGVAYTYRVVATATTGTTSSTAETS